MNQLEPPDTSTLWRGVWLHSIVHATMVAESPGLARGYSWNGVDFISQRGDGTNGAITFKKECIVGVFFDPDSKYSPFKEKEKYDINIFLRHMPAHHRSLAVNHVLRFNRQYVAEKLVPVITAAFWDMGTHLTSAIPWKEVVENGAHLIQIELMQEMPEAIEAWKDAYEMTTDQVSFASGIFERKMAEPNRIIGLDPPEVEWLERSASSAEALEDSRLAFAAMGIYIGRHCDWE